MAPPVVRPSEMIRLEMHNAMLAANRPEMQTGPVNRLISLERHFKNVFAGAATDLNLRGFMSRIGKLPQALCPWRYAGQGGDCISRTTERADAYAGKNLFPVDIHWLSSFRFRGDMGQWQTAT